MIKVALDKDTLLKKRQERTQTVTIPNVGDVIVRGLSRAEALRVQGKSMAAEDMEKTLVAMAMVEPKLTKQEVGTWQENSPAGELEPVTAAILSLSGMTQEAPKDTMKTFRSES